MVLIFDLDDTLYDEMTYVKSGLHAVAAFGRASYGWNEEDSYTFMDACLLKYGRGKVFDEWLRAHDHYSASRVNQCVHVYRHHIPSISLPIVAKQLLLKYQGLCSLYLVTDGHKIVQQKKIDALGIEALFKRCFVTHRFGIRHSKPSLYCFEKIKEVEKCDWSSMVYVGDNPAKDFVNLNAIGSSTVRVRTGSHAEVKARSGHDAQHTIQDLTHLALVLDQLIGNAGKLHVPRNVKFSGSIV
jgi:putative hydrolase of the HAD superfamily